MKINDNSREGIAKLHEILRNNIEYKDAYKKYDSALNNFRIAEYKLNKIKQHADAELTYLYPNFADMCSGATNNSFGFGHTRKYWKENDNNQENEFFAEIAAIKATGNKKELEMIRKFLPKSVKRWEEIVNDISKNKGKVLDLRL